VIVGRSYGNPGAESDYKSAAGVMGSRDDNLILSNVTFFNFGDSTNKKFTALRDCSVCDNNCERKTETHTLKVEKITFVNVTRKLFWNGPRRHIIQDNDGSFTESGHLSWLAP
jgi:hypothetical protein